MSEFTFPDFTEVLCPERVEHNEPPETFARDGFCDACGKTGHEEVS